MLHDKMSSALNAQINAETFSAYLYLSMASWFEDQGLSGFAAWMNTQAQEELTHAWRLVDYVHERGGRVVYDTIEKPQENWDSPQAIFDAALEHERYISGRINELVDLALELRDHATNNFLQWFVSEQVEEEATAEEIVDRLRLVGSQGHGLFMMDKELSARPPLFTLPADE